MAAAMALSMSAVAFAKDTQPGNAGIDGTVGEAGGSMTSKGQTIGITKTYKIDAGGYEFNTKDFYGTDGSRVLSAAALNDLLEDNLVAIDVSVSSGKNNLKSQPAVKVGDSATNAPVMSVTFKDTWGTGEVDAVMQIRITAKKSIYYGFRTSDKVPGYDGSKEKYTTDSSYKYAGTPDSADASPNALVLAKGDTITLDKFKLKAEYNAVTNYGENMTVTNQEVSDRNIVANGEALYDNADSNDKVIIYFKNGGYDMAAYEVKVATNQKSVNLAFNTKEDEAITKEFDDVEFEFINFEAQVSGANKFNNSGTLYFNAIGGEETAVYEVTDEGLIKLDTKWDSVDRTVAVSGIKYLTSYVVASKELPEEEPEEESSSSEAPAEVPETPANPSTGAL